MNTPRTMRGLPRYRSAVYTIPALFFLWTGCGQVANQASDLEADLMKISIDDLSSKLALISAPENAEKLKNILAQPFTDTLANAKLSAVEIGGTVLKPSPAFLAKLKAIGNGSKKSYKSTTDYLNAIGAKAQTKISLSDIREGLKIAAKILENPESLESAGDEQGHLALTDYGDEQVLAPQLGLEFSVYTSVGSGPAFYNRQMSNCMNNAANIGPGASVFKNQSFDQVAAMMPGNPAVQQLAVWGANVAALANNCRIATAPSASKKITPINQRGRKTPVTTTQQQKKSAGRPYGNRVEKHDGDSSCMSEGQNATCEAHSSSSRP